MRTITWPPLPTGDTPTWDGVSFRVAGASVPFLAYSQNFAGWDDDLTSLHNREAAGHHPIDVTSRHHAVASLRAFHQKPLSTVLEIGSSDGHMLRDVKAAYPQAMVVGAEVAPKALVEMAANLPATPLLQLDILDCPLAEKSFDAIIALNVLEHIDNDRGAIRNMAKLLAADGLLVVEVPAGPTLFDAYDKQLRHFRRYTMSELKEKIEAAGLEIINSTHVGFFIFPAFAAVKKLNRLRAKSLEGKDVVADSIRQSRGSWILQTLFALENSLYNRVSLPFGIRCFVSARKREH